jgi:DNA-binding HxlR family transcriptional regulator
MAIPVVCARPGWVARRHAPLRRIDPFINEHDKGDVLSQLERGPQMMEQLMQRTGLDERVLERVYRRIHEKGWVELLPDGLWRATDGAPRWGPKD